MIDLLAILLLATVAHVALTGRGDPATATEGDDA